MTDFGRQAAAGALIALSAASLAACSGLRTNTQSDVNRPSLKVARTALAEGEAATALGIARGVLSMAPSDVAALVAAGDADVALGNRRTAEGEYRKALVIDDGSIGARIGLAKMAMRDDAKEAEGLFRAIVQRAPNDAAALTDLGVCLDLQERHKEAQAVYARALATNADLTSTRVDLALSLALDGDPLRAEGMLRDATESGPVPPKVRADFALAEVMAGHADQAKATLQADLSADEAQASIEGMSALLSPQKKAN